MGPGGVLSLFCCTFLKNRSLADTLSSLFTVHILLKQIQRAMR
ncbi:hypothetical protein BN133_1405 [Cronobacter dublinensis 582]|nr:hypothetical protein BN133_1405 [Cronobacter dublinensis 582]